MSEMFVKCLEIVRLCAWLSTADYTTNDKIHRNIQKWEVLLGNGEMNFESEFSICQTQQQQKQQQLERMKKHIITEWLIHFYTEYLKRPIPTFHARLHRNSYPRSLSPLPFREWPSTKMSSAETLNWECSLYACCSMDETLFANVQVNSLN